MDNKENTMKMPGRPHKENHATMADIIHSAGITSAACVAAACAMDNALWDKMPQSERHEWTLFAFEIQELMQHGVEPRFCLYDYLDASINCIGADWVKISAAVHLAIASKDTDTMDAAFQRLIEMAAQKRDVYTNT